MEGFSIFLSILFLIIVTFIGLIRAQTLIGVFVCFILLNIISFITIYLFKAD